MRIRPVRSGLDPDDVFALTGLAPLRSSYKTCRFPARLSGPVHPFPRAFAPASSPAGKYTDSEGSVELMPADLRRSQTRYSASQVDRFGRQERILLLVPIQAEIRQIGSRDRGAGSRRFHVLPGWSLLRTWTRQPESGPGESSQPEQIRLALSVEPGWAIGPRRATPRRCRGPVRPDRGR